MGKTTTFPRGHPHKDFGIARIPDGPFDQNTPIQHVLCNPGPLMQYSERGSDVFLFTVGDVAIPALRSRANPNGRTNFLVLTSAYPGAEQFAHDVLRRLLAPDVRANYRVCIPRAVFGPFVFLYFHANMAYRNMPCRDDSEAPAPLRGLLADLGLSGTSTCTVNNNWAQKASVEACIDGHWMDYIRATIAGFLAGVQAGPCRRGSKRPRASGSGGRSKRPAPSFNGMTLAEIFAQLDRESAAELLGPDNNADEAFVPAELSSAGEWSGAEDDEPPRAEDMFGEARPLEEVMDEIDQFGSLQASLVPEAEDENMDLASESDVEDDDNSEAEDEVEDEDESDGAEESDEDGVDAPSFTQKDLLPSHPDDDVCLCNSPRMGSPHPIFGDDDKWPSFSDCDPYIADPATYWPDHPLDLSGLGSFDALNMLL